ncbi:MAG: EamA family transporter [Paenibacillaceae bacterium]|nr:EamA family transporter [Paenibacillaceae bacterium]
MSAPSAVRSSQQAIAHAAFLLVYLIWGANMASMKVGGREWDPFLFNGLRFLCIVPIVWVYTYAYYRRRSLRISIAWRDLLLILGLGALSAIGVESLLSYALQFTSTANAAVLGRGLSPLFTVLFLLAVRAAAFNWRLAVGLPLACAGAFIIVAGGHGLHFGPETMRGDLLLVLRSVFGAVYLLGMSRLLGKYPLPLLFALEMTASAAVLLPAVFVKAGGGALIAMTTDGWLSFGYTTLVGTLIGFSLHNWSLGRLGALKSSFYGYTQPFFAAIAGYIVLTESISSWQWIGGLAVMAAMLLVQWDKLRGGSAGRLQRKGGRDHAAHDVRRTKTN